jgi:para-nitrobenzyl esterase
MHMSSTMARVRLLVCIIALSVCVHATIIQSLVQTDAGLVQGKANTRWGGLGWLGIPFAGSVSGDARWKPAVPPTPWGSNPYDATQWPVGCLSVHHNKDVANVTVEDCLNLNVFVPLNASTDTPLPVLFWVYGGGFAEGANTGPFGLYDGSHIANAAQVVVVATNYRLGTNCNFYHVLWVLLFHVLCIYLFLHVFF